MSFLALDIATTTGWAYGDAGEKPQHGTHTCPSTGDDLGRYGDSYERWLTGLLRTLRPKLLVYEAPVLPQPKFNRKTGKIEQKTTIDTLRKLYGLVFVTELVALREAVPCEEIWQGQWRKNFLGTFYPRNGERDDFKRAAIAACRQMRWEPNGSDDAEAMGIWFVVTRTRDPRFAANEALQQMMGTPAA